MKYTRLPKITGAFVGRKPRQKGSWVWPQSGNPKGINHAPTAAVEKVGKDILRELLPSMAKAERGKREP